MYKDIKLMGLQELVAYKERIAHNFLLDVRERLILCDNIRTRITLLSSDAEAVYSDISADENDFEH